MSADIHRLKPNLRPVRAALNERAERMKRYEAAEGRILEIWLDADALQRVLRECGLGLTADMVFELQMARVRVHEHGARDDNCDRRFVRLLCRHAAQLVRGFVDREIQLADEQSPAIDYTGNRPEGA